MEEYKKYCGSCRAVRDILEIKRDDTGGSIKLSCGHNLVYDEIREEYKKIIDWVAHEEKKDKSNKILLESNRREDDEKLGIQKQQVHTFNHEKRVRYHSVQELGQDGNWKTVFGPEPRPFSEKKKK